MAILPKTAADFLEFFYDLPKSERDSVIKRIEASNSEFDDQNLTETYKGIFIEVFRCEMEEKIHGPERWTAVFVRDDGQRILEGGIYTSSEDALKATRFLLDWELDQDKICNSFEKVIEEFKHQGQTQAGILSGLSDAINHTLDASNWKNALIDHLEEATRAATLPGRLLP